MHNTSWDGANECMQFPYGAELADYSLDSNVREIIGKKIIFDSEGGMVPINGWQSRLPETTQVVKTIRPVRDGSLVAAVDSSCARVGETEDGVLYAAKCGIALGQAQKPLMHFKIGPSLFYITEKAVAESALDRRLARVVLLDSETAMRFIRIRLERSIQLRLAQLMSRGIILVDGSLKSSQFETRQENIAALIESSTLNRNCLVGVSKRTKLKVLERLGGTLDRIPYASSLDVTAVIKSLLRGVAGDTVLAKLSGSGPVLRADVVDAPEESLGRLVGNDSIASGYPETLRLAHHISTFSGAELAGVRAHVVASCGVTELAAGDLRASILGSMPV